jgi:hypothetical protein
MDDRNHDLARMFFSMLTAAWLTGGATACSDDKPEHAAPGASAGAETRPEHSDNPIDEAHGDFKDAVRPAAGWVDDKSHRAADELNTAAGKVKESFEEDEPAPAPAKDKPGTAAPAASALDTQPTTPTK